MAVRMDVFLFYLADTVVPGFKLCWELLSTILIATNNLRTIPNSPTIMHPFLHNSSAFCSSGKPRLGWPGRRPISTLALEFRAIKAASLLSSLLSEHSSTDDGGVVSIRINPTISLKLSGFVLFKTFIMMSAAMSSVGQCSG